MEVKEDRPEVRAPVEEPEPEGDPDVRIDSDSVWVPRHMRKHGAGQGYTDHGPPRRGKEIDILDEADEADEDDAA